MWLVRAILCFVLSAFLGIYSFYQYADLGRWEQEGGTRMLSSITRIEYSIGGRTGVLVGGLLFALILAGLGVQHVRRKLASNG
jgi:hypothetical protein